MLAPRPLLAAPLIAFVLLAVGCSDDDTGGGAGSDELVTVDITFEGDSVTPNGDRVDVDAGQPIDLVVTADEPGEIHLHAEPEQTFEYEGGGATTTIEVSIDRPGVVEVESHELDQVIVQLEVQ